MKAILKAFRDALVANSTLTDEVPAANIYAGVRDLKTPLPAIDVFIIGEPTEKLAGAKVGGITIHNMSLQISIIADTDNNSLTILELVQNVIFSDNSTLNAAGVKDITKTNSNSTLEDNGFGHIPLTITCRYMTIN